MPRRKRTTEDGGRRAKVSRVEHIEETVVLSDSEHEEGEDCAPKSSSRAARCKRRENESQLQEMTEDEMMALAMRLSAQEANTAAQRQQQLEDDEIQKAIAESLHDSSRKSSANRNHAASSSAQPQQSFDDVMLHLRRKLSYPSKDDAQSGEESPAAYGDENERETSSPLPEMPDLSQTTPSHLSLSHSAPHANSQRVCESSQSHTADEQPISRDSQLSQSVSQPRFSPVFHSQGSLIRQPLVCVERLSQDVIRATTDSRDHLLTQDSAQDSSQDSPPPKSPVFSKTDYKGSADLIKDTDERSTAEGNDTASTPIPDVDGDLPIHQSHKGLSPEKCLSPSGGSQPSSPRCVPESDSADVTIQIKSPELKQGKDQVTRGENETADSERPANTVETHSWEEYTSHMVLHLTDDDDESEEDDGPHSPSPVFDKEPARPKISPTQPCVTPAEITHAKSPSSQDAQTSQRALQEDSRPSRDPEPKACGSKTPRAAAEAGERTVSYYWGVPFCPLGQNPDDYTQVILAQMEVYEKSLKEAQRGLLRKTDWGQPVFPSERPFGTRRWKRHRAPQLSEDEEENVEEKENDRIEVEEEEQQQQEKEVVREPSVVGSEEGAEGGQSETYVVLSSPETKDEQSQKSADFTQKELTAASRSIRKNGQWDTSDDTQIQHPDEQEEEEAQDHEGFDDERMVCPETQMTENSTPELMVTSPASPTQPQSRADSEVMEVEEEGGSPVLEDVVMEQEGVPAEAVAAAPHSQQVECPMCSKLFPLSRVEMHAAYCDGGGEDQDHQEEQVISQRTRTRRDVTEDAFHRSVKSAEMEKCYVCKGSFPHQEYLKHVALCFRKNKPKTKQGNGLLSALAQTERRHTRSDEAGPSNISIKNTSGLADSLGNAAGGSVDRNASSSPSQTFTAPLEDTDCLIDFTQQDSKNSQRLSRKRKFKR